MGEARMVRRDEAALVVVDIQERLAAAMAEHERVLRTTGRLVRSARLLGWPVLVTRQYPRGLGDLVPDLAAMLDAEERAGAEVLRVDKTAFCCAAEPSFADALAATERRQVVLTGMETHVCVSQTALALAAEGLDVFVAADGCCSRRQLDHDTALARVRAEGVVVTTWEAAVYEAAERAATDEFRALLTVVKQG